MITNSKLKEKHFLELQKIFDDVSSVTDEDIDKIFKQIQKAATVKVSVNVYWDPNSKTKLNVTPKRNSTYLLFNFLMRIEKESVLKKTFKERINLFLESLKDTIAIGEISPTKLPGQMQMEKSNKINLLNYCVGKFPLSIVPNKLMKDFLFGFLYESDSPSEPVVGETYYLFSIELKEIYRLGGAVTEYYFSAFKEYFKSLLNKLKKDLIDENRDERFIFGQKNDIYVESDSYLQGDFPLEILSENQLKMFFSYVFKTNETLFGLIEDNGKVVEELSHYQQYIDEVIATLRLLGISYFLDDDDNFKLLTQLKNTNKKFSKNDLETFISDLSKLSKVWKHFNSETVSEIIKTVAEQGLPQLSVVGISNLVLMIEDFDLNVCDFIQTYELKTFISYDTIQEFLDNNYCGDFDLCDCIFHIQQATLSKLKINLRKTEVINPLHFFDGILSFVLSFSEREENSEKVKFILTEELLPHLKLLQENPQLLVSKVCSEEEVRKAFEYFVKN